jgi:hypothetical protein
LGDNEIFRAAVAAFFVGGYPNFFSSIGVEGFFTTITTSIENDVSVEEDARGKIEFVKCAALGWSIREFGCSSFGVEAGETVAVVINNAVMSSGPLQSEHIGLIKKSCPF